MVIARERLIGTRYGVYLSRIITSWKRKSWVPVEIWNKWCVHWSTSEAKAKSDKACRNRRGGGSGPAKATHTGGSVFTRTSAKRMETRLGRTPSLVEVFHETHPRNHDGQSFVDDRSKKVSEDIELCREELGVEEGVDTNQLYLETVGGKDK